MSGNLAVAVDEIAGFTTGLDDLAEAAASTLRVADDLAGSVDALTGRASQTLDAGTEALDAARRTLDTTEAFVARDLAAAAEEARATTAVLRERIDAVAGDARRTLVEIGAAGQAATARLDEADATLAAADALLASATDAAAAIEAAAARLDTLAAGPGEALAAEARDAVASANATLDAIGTAVETDLPTIMADIRSAARQVDRTAGVVGDDLAAASGNLASLAEGARTDAGTGPRHLRRRGRDPDGTRRRPRARRRRGRGGTSAPSWARTASWPRTWARWLPLCATASPGSTPRSRRLPTTFPR